MAEPLDAIEREQLCDLFLELGPDAPTLCAAWATLDLAAHLVVRERDPRAGLAIVGGARFADLGNRLLERAKKRGYDTLVEKVRSGPPLGPMAVPGLRTVFNLNEYFVHHEDVRRANGRARRTDRPDLDAALWSLLKRGARLQLRRVRGVRVELSAPGYGEVAIGHGPVARLESPPSELALYLNGRKSHAEVERTGDPDALGVLDTADLGI